MASKTRIIRTELLAIIILIAIAAFLASACGGGSSARTSSTSPSTVPASEISKPKPTVVIVNATTSGVFENYYAILDITAKNEGADGVVIVVGSITQNGETQRNEIPVYLTKGSAQIIKLVFPIKWKAGEWTPSVSTEVP